MNTFIDPQNLLDANAEKAGAFASDRRGFLKHGLLFTAALGFWTPALATPAFAALKGREIRLANIHTGEKFSGEYWYDGKYDSSAFSGIKSLMRDYRTGDRFPIDPRLMDVLFVLQHRVENFKPFHVYSGYRSPKTNAMLRRNTPGVARRSLHMQGQAIDLGQDGSRLSSIRNAAITLHAGGVGFYPSSDFVHIDTGRVRSW